MKQKITEAQLAEWLIQWLTLEGCEVFQEVEHRGCRIDIVAKRGAVIWAIECKLSFGFPVIEQAQRNIPYAHYSSIAVPYMAGRNPFGERCCNLFGIGVLRVSDPDQKYRPEAPNEGVKPRLNRRLAGSLFLHEKQKTICAAGTNGGGHWTKFKGTKETIISTVTRNPGIHFKDLIEVMDHHYNSNSTAKSCLRNLIGTSVIPEVKFETIAGKLCVVPAGGK